MAIKELSCEHCGNLLGTISKGKIKTDIVFICKKCYNSLLIKKATDFNNSNDISKIKDLFGGAFK